MEIYWPNEIRKRNDRLIRGFQEREDPLNDRNFLNEFMIINKALIRPTYEFLFNNFDSLNEEKSFQTLILIDIIFFTNVRKNLQIWDYEFFDFIVSKLLGNNKYNKYGLITLHLFIQRFSEYDIYLLMNKLKKENQKKLIEIIIEGVMNDLEIEKNPNNFFKILYEKSFGPAFFFYIENLNYIYLFNKILGHFFNKRISDPLIPYKSKIISIIEKNENQLLIKTNIFTLFKAIYLLFYEKEDDFFKTMNEILKKNLENITNVEKVLELAKFLENQYDHPFFLKFYKYYFNMVVILAEDPKNIHLIGELFKNFNIYALKDENTGGLIDIEFFKYLLEKLEFYYRTGESLLLNEMYQIVESLIQENVKSREKVIPKESEKEASEFVLFKIEKNLINERIRRIIKKIPSLNKDRIKKWLNNFLEKEQEFALKLLENFKFIGAEELKESCLELYITLISSITHHDLHIKIPEDLIFVNFGEQAKSSEMISYYFRLATNLPEKCFQNLYNPKIETIPKNKAIIYVDDISGSGNQFLDYWKDFKEKMKIRWKDDFNDFLESNVLIYLPLFITESGKIIIENNSNFKVIYLPHHLLTNKHVPLSNECDIFTRTEIEQAREIFLKYGKKLYPKAPLGYGDTGLLITFFYNTPNNTLPIIWQKSPSKFCDSMINWEPLFPRHESKREG